MRGASSDLNDPRRALTPQLDGCLFKNGSCHDFRSRFTNSNQNSLLDRRGHRQGQRALYENPGPLAPGWFAREIGPRSGVDFLRGGAVTAELRIGLDEITCHFADLHDPRSSVDRLHPFISVVVLASMGVLAATATTRRTAKERCTRSAFGPASSDCRWDKSRVRRNRTKSRRFPRF